MLYKRLSLFFITLLFLPLVVQAQTDEGCVTAKCHADIATKEFIHGPVGAKICTVCHTETDKNRHTFEFTMEKEELCFACHETKRDMMLEDHLHTPVSDGDCVGCHDPHQSDHRFTLKDNAANLCYKCHKKESFSHDFVHGPVAVGDCNACHNPHASGHENQLVEAPDKICFRCHEEQSGMLSKRHVHDPVAESCTNCHNPHSEKAKFLLPKTPPDLCIGCHTDYDNYSSLEFPHQPVQNGKCTDCHDVHSSEHPKMFVTETNKLCFSCHNEMEDYILAQQHKHGPVKDGDCNACHNPHGSENYKILRKYFPEEFYMPYKTENYASCFDCHNQNLALDPKTTTLTDFRSGDINLHYLHVNKDTKGRSCKACHQAHATDQMKHIRKSVPFGSMSWELPVQFTKTENGGNCVVGCHSPKDYVRK